MPRLGQDHSVPQTPDIPRRWSGYVCPECRSIFRVALDHDLAPIRCPGCQHVLKIPTSADTPPPLLLPKDAGIKGPQKKKRRRNSKSRADKAVTWEQQKATSRHDGRENRQLRVMLIGGAALFALILSGVFVSMYFGGKAAEQSAHVVKATTKPAAAIAPPAERSDASYLAEAEPLTRKFMQATTVAEMLPLVRNPATAEVRMRAFYPDGHIPAPGISKFDSDGGFSVKGKHRALSIVTGEQEIKSIAFVETAQGMKVDWESWVGWSDIPWETFITTRPTVGHLFRVILKHVDYYNFEFADDLNWKSYSLVSPDREHVLFGYLPKASALNQQLDLSADSKRINVILSLKFPAVGSSKNQVEIERVIAKGWVEEDGL